MRLSKNWWQTCNVGHCINNKLDNNKTHLNEKNIYFSDIITVNVYKKKMFIFVIFFKTTDDTELTIFRIPGNVYVRNTD